MSIQSEDLTGRKFDRLTPYERAEDYKAKNGNVYAMWKCHCSCGNDVIVAAQSLIYGKTKSCGCYRKEMARQRGLASKGRSWSDK